MKHYIIKLLMLVIILFSTNTFAQPPIMSDRQEKNVFGGYNYYSRGKLTYRSTRNVFNSYNVYNHTKLEYRGVKQGNFERYIYTGKKTKVK